MFQRLEQTQGLTHTPTWSIPWEINTTYLEVQLDLLVSWDILLDGSHPLCSSARNRREYKALEEMVEKIQKQFKGEAKE